MNRFAHEDLHDDPRILRWTSGSATIANADQTLRQVTRRPHHIGQVWWGVEAADSTNNIDIEIIINTSILLNVTLTKGQTESQVGVLDVHTNVGDVLIARINGTITNLTGPWWVEFDVYEAFA